MRVAHLLRKYDPTEWGGTETAIYQLTGGLAGHGVESIVYAPRIPPLPGPVDPLASAGRPVHRFRAHVPILGLPPERRRQLVALGGNPISFDLPRALWRERDLDVIHSHTLGRLGAIGRLVARSRRIPFVLSIHGGLYDLPPSVREGLVRPAHGGWDWGRPLGLLLRTRHLLTEADAVITVNPREAALIKERHPNQRVFIASHGVPAAVFAQDRREAARAAYPELEGRWPLLVLGRIDPTKNQEWLIAQAKELVRRHPRIILVFVGACTNEEYGQALRARIARDGLEGQVLLTGGLPFGDPRLVGLLQEARAVIVPSVAETFGIVILEAWAAGAPVISSRTTGATTLVREGTNGLLFDLERPESFHAAMDGLLRRPGLGLALGAAGRSRVIAEFDTAMLAGRVKRLYEDLIEQRHALRHPARR